MLGAPEAPCASTTTLGTYLGPKRLDVPQSYGGMFEGMRACLANHGRHVVLEITSETLARGFAQLWPCDVGVFTNLSHDHLDAHGSVEHYFASKAQLFHTLGAGARAVINGNDEVAPLLAEVLSPGVELVTYGMASRTPELPLDLVGQTPIVDWNGTHFSVDLGARGGAVRLSVPTVGDVFAENALGALAAAINWGVDPLLAAERLQRCPSIPGRFECVVEAPRVVVDYAHSPDALERTLRTARKLCPGSLHLVFGAGGGRDRFKRPLMGQAAGLADRIFLTSDNPRREDPARIASEILEGVEDASKVRTLLDRRQAIECAIRGAAPDDVVVIAGKGHETGQIIGDTRTPFSDREEALRVARAD
jgi:UDP-N-acetylmuramoyl-L-alanyl-D-glutamate--2,6-diaminopimelate ligase